MDIVYNHIIEHNSLKVKNDSTNAPSSSNNNKHHQSKVSILKEVFSKKNKSSKSPPLSPTKRVDGKISKLVEQYNLINENSKFKNLLIKETSGQSKISPPQNINGNGDENINNNKSNCKIVKNKDESKFNIQSQNNNIINNNHVNYQQLLQPCFYIFSLDLENNITLFNINSHTFQKINYIKCIGKFSIFSMVATEKYVYIFGGYDRMINKYQRVSLRTMDVDMEGNIPLNNFSQFRSVCYDGEDNIYMVQYNDSFSDDDIDYNYFVPKFNSRIDVFNIKNQTFKTLVKFKEDIQMDNRIILQSFIFRNSIYMVCYQKGLVIIEFNLTNKTLKYYLRVTKTEEYRVICACHDGNGNIYIHFRDRFFKMNLVTKTVTELQEFDRVLNSFYSMVFHTFHDRLHVVYLLGGSTFGNHMYIVELNLWRSLTYEYMDRSFRELCGSTLIKL